MTDSERILNELKAARERAAALVAALRESQQRSDPSSRDIFKQVAGQSSLERSVATAVRALESYDRLIEEQEGSHAPAVVTLPRSPGIGRMTVAALYSGRTA